MDSYHFQHLNPRELARRDDFLSLTHDIEYGMSGRVDVMGLHGFFVEAACLLRNSIKVYEEGVFDAAFYCVRAALELARIITHFSEQDDPMESDIYIMWKQSASYFPTDSKIRKRLKAAGKVYTEVRSSLAPFFDSQDERLERAQKYIHKQSYASFYGKISWRPDVVKSRSAVVDDFFQEFLSNTIIEIALLRLCIDPYPVLLLDKDVSHKIHYQSITIPFSISMIDLIGEELLANYRKTDFYESHKRGYLSNEELNEATYNLINHEFYDRAEREAIVSQSHLISDNDKAAIELFDISDDLTYVYLDGGLSWYVSSTRSVRAQIGPGRDRQDAFQRMTSTDQLANLRLDDAYVSYFSSGKARTWIEHNKKLDKESLDKIQGVLDDRRSSQG